MLSRFLRFSVRLPRSLILAMVGNAFIMAMAMAIYRIISYLHDSFSNGFFVRCCMSLFTIMRNDSFLLCLWAQVHEDIGFVSWLILMADYSFLSFKYRCGVTICKVHHYCWNLKMMQLTTSKRMQYSVITTNECYTIILNRLRH